MAVVPFEPEAFCKAYPHFADTPEALLQSAFEQAALLADNTEASHIPYDPPHNTARRVIMYALMCHVLTLRARGPLAVGSLASASEGSVSASFSAAPSTPDNAYLAQTQCGLFALTLMKRYAPRGPYYYDARALP